MTSPARATRNLQESLIAVGATVATAESLTGGLLGAALTSVPGSSAVYLGGVVTYATELKVSLLGVAPAIVSDFGVVSAQCAEAMAAAVRSLTGSSYGVSTTGVAGPDVQEGKAVGTVYVGIAGPVRVTHVALSLTGDRGEIRDLTVAAAVSALSEQVSMNGGTRLGEESGLG
jgi:nicotinamide-nucleotide amidase